MEKINNWLWTEHEETSCTNDDVKELCSGAESGKKFVVTTKRQSSGRGRRGRSWVSLEGNLFVSFGLEVELRDLGQMVFVVSLSLLETIEALQTGLEIKLKWPNDVLINDRKISGILLEKAAGNYLVIGVGVNISTEPDATDLLYPATSLQAVGINIERIEFLRSFINYFDNNLSEWKDNGFASIKKRWLNKAQNLGKAIFVNTELGSKTGIFNGVDDNGILLLATPNGIEKIYAGDVFFKGKE